MTFLLWLILLFLCWPLALLVLVLYPFVWLILLPLRIFGIAIEGVLELLRAIILLPARILRGPRRAWSPLSPRSAQKAERSGAPTPDLSCCLWLKR
jgi:hypothetical protein